MTGNDETAIARRVAVLRSSPAFEPLAEGELTRLARAIVDLRFDAGVVVARQGDEPHYVYLVVEGEVELRHGGQRLAVRGPGELLGETGLLRSRRRHSTVVAVGPVALYALEGTAFAAAVAANRRGGRLDA